MTVKMTAAWEIASCDECGTKNETDEHFPKGWCLLAWVDSRETLRHKAICPNCEPEDPR